MKHLNLSIACQISECQFLGLAIKSPSVGIACQILVLPLQRLMWLAARCLNKLPYMVLFARFPCLSWLLLRIPCVGL